MAERVSVNVNTVKIVKLDNNPTTGYEWIVKSSNDDVVTVTHKGYTPQGSMVGSGGYDTFSIKGRKPGNASVSFEYKRSWENDAVERKVYSVSVSP
ncbi:hypothetical protein AKO1_006985 [Acrasis kona]|uniref:Proteinase inhibitor I42 chagasin domain-containing protein n=1 Tax=Acrasis kona TaxID=1008807 RepID=A0AAW2YV79_9EUKA